MRLPDSENPFVSIIDDDPGMRDSLVDLMQSAGYVVAAFADAEAFLQSGERWKSQCIITDIQMPGMSGFELKQQLDQEHSQVPVIMMTARDEASAKIKAEACGAFCFLPKPFLPSALFACVERSLAR